MFFYKPSMASQSFIFCFSTLLLFLYSGIEAEASSVPFGINYGQIADNLPPPEKVVPILQAIGIKKVKLYDTDSRVLRAFANTDIEFIVGLANECLPKMRDTSKAVAWIKENVQAYLPATKITCITVGNEILTSNDTTLTQSLLPAMQSMYTALQTLNLHKQVSITTAHSLAILQTSYPPSSGSFNRQLVPFIAPILKFHDKTCSPFLINAYPFLAYKANPKKISLNYVLFESESEVVDPRTGFKYDNMLFAQIDAIYSALEELGHGRVAVKISETGWPSKGDEDEAGATLENAKKYNGNLMKLLEEKKGTPMRPNGGLDVYVFALFNENMKPGPTSERNFGLFKPDGTPAYSLGLGSFNVSGGSSSVRGGGAGGISGDGVTPAPSGGSTSGFLNISSDTALRFGGAGTLHLIKGVVCAAFLLVYF